MGKIAGHRGTAGELTVRVPSGDAARWTALGRVQIAPSGSGVEQGRFYEVEHSRAYRDRLVLKLKGIDDAGAARGLRGASVNAAREDAPPLADDEHYTARLVGMSVEDETGAMLGTVTDVMPTGGVDLLVVAAAGQAEGRETLIPMAREIVIEICEARGRIRVRPPAGLLELNRS